MMDLRIISLALFACFPGSCAGTPRYVERGGGNRVVQVTLSGVSPTEAQAHVVTTSPAIFVLVEQKPGTSVCRTPEPVRPVMFARWTYTPRAGGTVVRLQEEYHIDGRVMVVNNPAFLDREQTGLNHLLTELPPRISSVASQPTRARSIGSFSSARQRCSALTREGINVHIWPIATRHPASKRKRPAQRG